jgi:hydroxymethylpyrimidine pyrophosphatase-like HAD family hydrolase
MFLHKIISFNCENNYFFKINDSPNNVITNEAIQFLEFEFFPKLSSINSEAKIKLIKETINNKCYQYVLFVDDKKIYTSLLTELDKIKNEYNLFICTNKSDNLIIINHAQTNKKTALDDFVKNINIPAEKIIKFGDTATKKGNDVPLLCDNNSYNVGKKPAVNPFVINTDEEGPEGVLKVLNNLPEIPKAIAADYDGTLRFSTSKSKFIDPNVAKKFKDYLEKGTKIAFISSRGTSLFDIISNFIDDYKLEYEAINNIHCYLFNGAIRSTGRDVYLFKHSLNKSKLEQQYEYVIPKLLFESAVEKST